MTAADPSCLVIAAVIAGYVLMLIGVYWARHVADDHHRQRRLEHAQFMREMDHYRTEGDGYDDEA